MRGLVLLVLLAMVLVCVQSRTKSANSFKQKEENVRSPYVSPRRRDGSRSSQAPSLATKRFKPLYTAREREVKATKRPNIVLILTDDQDVELGSLQFMPKLNKHLKEQGAIYENGFVSTPMCCPSRSSMLTGLYVHNHKVYTNNDNCSSTFWIQEHETRTFGAYLQDSGYSTGYFGKYLNKYQGQRVPPGWGEWHGLLRNSRFYNYSLNVNGQIHHHGFDYQKDYLPDIITNRSINFLKWSKMMDPNTPVLAVLSYPGPHGPEDAAPQYQHLFHNVTTHHTPAYDFAPNPDKQWILRHTDKMLPVHKHFTDMLMTKRLQTLQSVDDAIERVVSLLDDLDELDNTYIFYTADHGYHLGQYGLVKGKAFPFDVDTKVPFLVRGPGIKKNSVISDPVVNIDLAPTFLDIAGLEKPPHMDGESILPTLVESPTSGEQRKPWRSAFLLERGKMTFQRYAKVSQETENEVLNEQFQDLLTSDRLTKQERLEIECKKPRYKAPCKDHQKWYCKERAGGGMRMKRCRSSLESRFGLATEDSMCHCREGDLYGWKYSNIDEEEKSMQRRFLRQHVPEARSIEKKFLKTLPRIQGWRNARSVDEFQGIFEDVAHDELEEVDGLVEDIAEEIRDLHNLNVTDDKSTPGCKLDRHNVICSNDIISDKQAWETSRSTVKHQIQRLRAQLNELKQIRKYLRVRRPAPRKSSRKLPVDLHSYRLDTDLAALAADNAEICQCDKLSRKEAERKLMRAARLREREEKKVEKMRRKEARRVKEEKKEKRKGNTKKVDHCKQDVKMNCFSHDNDHWKTAPLWTEGPFCACTNSNNNTYWCVRNINSTHNYLYCEYVTGMVTYFDLRVDPHQLRNVLHTLTDVEVNYMHSQVIELREYSAAATYLQTIQQQQEARKQQLLLLPQVQQLRQLPGRQQGARRERRLRQEQWKQLSRKEKEQKIRKWRRNRKHGSRPRGA